jgi:predicted nucleic acid-binding protein
MNGPTDKAYVYDSNTVIDHLDLGTPLKAGKPYISVVTEMEVLAKSDMSGKDEAFRKGFLANSLLTIIPLNDEVKDIAIRARRFGKPRPKLPDAIVAATAVMLGVPLVSNDEKMLKLRYRGLKVEGSE